jgi:hypothetical protein
MAEKEKLSKEEKAVQNAVIREIMADFGLEGVTKKRLVWFVGDNENWDRRMIECWLKRALIAETYAAKGHYNWDGCSGGRETRGLLPAGWVSVL